MTKRGPIVGSKRWNGLVTASKVPAIIGLSPWVSPYSLWLQMTGQSGDDGRNVGGKARGHYLENGIIDWWLDQHPGTVGKRQQWSPFEDWAGATTDLTGTDPDGRKYVLEVKTDGGDIDWTDGPPPHYLAQVLFQMWCTGADIGYIAVLYSRLKFEEFEVERDDDLVTWIINRCREFHQSLSLPEPPFDLDDTIATYEAVKRAHPAIEAGAEAEIPADLAHAYVFATMQEDDAKTAARFVKTRLLAAMGDVQTAALDGQKIARRQAGPHGSVVLRRSTTRINP